MSTRRAARERGAIEDRPATVAQAARAVRAARLPDFARGGAAAAVAEDVEARGPTSTPLRAAAAAAAAAVEAVAAAAAATAATSATATQGTSMPRNRRSSRNASGDVGDAAAPGGYIGDGGGGGNDDGEGGNGGDDFGGGAVYDTDPADQLLEQGENGESGGEEETEYPTDCPCGRQNYEPTTGQYVLCETCWSWKHSSCEALSDEVIVAMTVPETISVMSA